MIVTGKYIPCILRVYNLFSVLCTPLCAVYNSSCMIYIIITLYYLIIIKASGFETARLHYQCSLVKVIVHHFRKIEGCLKMATSFNHWYQFSSPKDFLNLLDSRKNWLQIALCLLELRILNLKINALTVNIKIFINKYLTRI